MWSKAHCCSKDHQKWFPRQHPHFIASGMRQACPIKGTGALLPLSKTFADFCSITVKWWHGIYLIIHSPTDLADGKSALDRECWDVHSQVSLLGVCEWRTLKMPARTSPRWKTMIPGFEAAEKCRAIKTLYRSTWNRKTGPHRETANWN